MYLELMKACRESIEKAFLSYGLGEAFVAIKAIFGRRIKHKRFECDRIYFKRGERMYLELMKVYRESIEKAFLSYGF